MQERGHWGVRAAGGTKGWWKWQGCSAFWNERFVILLLLRLPAGITTPNLNKNRTAQSQGKHLALTCGLWEAAQGWRASCPAPSVAQMVQPWPWDQAEGNQPFDLHPIRPAKVTPDLQSYYFPNVCGSSDSPPSASQCAVVGNRVTGLSSPWPGNME